MYESISEKEFYISLFSSLDKVSKGHNPLLVTRPDGQDVVIIPKNDYVALEETAYLLRSPKNAERLFQALHRNQEERIVFHNLADLKNEIGI